MAFAAVHSQDSPAKTPNYVKNGKNNKDMSFLNTLKAVESLNQTTLIQKSLDTYNLTPYTIEELQTYVNTHHPAFGDYQGAYYQWQVKAEIAKRKGLPIPEKPSNPFGIDYSKKTENRKINEMLSELPKDERVKRMLAISKENKEKQTAPQTAPQTTPQQPVNSELTLPKKNNYTKLLFLGGGLLVAYLLFKK